MLKIFLPTPEKHPGKCPAQPLANIPRAGGKMYPPEKNPRNEKIKALKAQAANELDQMMNQFMESKAQKACIANLIRTQIILIDLLDTLIEPEEPE